ncbi:MAG: asparagine synthetase B, partial [Alphaproteobacteria bacterium]
MCGIAGVLNGERLAADLIAALAHRGPDGIRTESLPGANLAHARLSIIDLEGGWQPLHAAGSVVVGNGEIYNYLELAQDHGLGPLLATGSDFEPLLHLYAREGPDAFRRLRGMYALCLVGGDGRTWLVRDPFGIKPLYLLERDGAVIFASEPRAFLAAGLIDPVMDASAAEDLLGLSYTTGETTIFPALPAGPLAPAGDGRGRSGRPAGRRAGGERPGAPEVRRSLRP